jgi:hypothetical protein
MSRNEMMIEAKGDLEFHRSAKILEKFAAEHGLIEQEAFWAKSAKFWMESVDRWLSLAAAA